MAEARRVRLSNEVRDALQRGAPVVALESTIVTHGLPRPRNLELAQRLESVVREEGGIPATTGVVGGDLVVGLSPNELERLAFGEADKASHWNIGAIVAKGGDAGTTVATTLLAAHLAGISVFATGGIGGVHDAPFDESADLPALSHYSVLTVCAGPKSILDADATVERLETLGVALVGYRSDNLAGFLVEQTGIKLPSRVDTPKEAAAVLAANRDLGLSQGVLLSNPVSQGLSKSDFDALLARANEKAHQAGVKGREATPFMLASLAELSEGRTVDVNLRLVEENTRLATAVATAIAAMGGSARRRS
ncbi:MAG: pseudouridine-5'-phosphate glycosidase [Trueperaceae bacterium]